MASLDATAQEIVTFARTENARRGGAAAVRPCYTNTAAIAEAVMGHGAWEAYKNRNYKSMKGPRAPEGSAATKKRVTARNKKMGGSMAAWTLSRNNLRVKTPYGIWMTH